MHKKDNIPGSLYYVERLIKRLENVRKVISLSPQEKAIITSIMRQELLRRKIAEDNKKRWKELGIDMNLISGEEDV